MRNAFYKGAVVALFVVGGMYAMSQADPPAENRTAREWGFRRAGKIAFSNSAYAYVLKKTTRNGLVDYRSLKTDPEKLNQYIGQISEVNRSEFDGWPKEERLAFLINAYNANVLHLVIQHFPVNSIKDIGGRFKSPFKQPVVSLFGQKISLDDLENEWIRKRFDEPRVHFALVCAAISCPSLRSEPFQGDKLEEQLKDQGREFMSNRVKNWLDPPSNTLYLSPYFKWFREDFEKKAGSVAEFIKPYFIDESQKVNWNTIKIKHTEYDWSLNDIRSRQHKS